MITYIFFFLLSILSGQTVREEGNLVFDGIPPIPEEIVTQMNSYDL